MAGRSEETDEFGLTSRQRHLIRQDARRIAATRDAVEKSLRLANSIEHDLGRDKEFEVVAQKYVDDLNHLLATSYFTRPLVTTSFFERIRDALAYDKFLGVATTANAVFAAASIYFAIHTADYDLVKRFIQSVWNWFFPSAQAATEQAATTIPATIDKGFWVVALLAGSQLLAFALLGASKNSDSRKFAADYLKVSLGVYVGAASKYLT